MRTRTTVAALGAASLLLLTACGDDDSDESTETEEGGYESAEDLGVEDAEAFLSNYVTNLSGPAQHSYAAAEENDDGTIFSTIGAECDDGSEDIECEVLGGTGQTFVHQKVTVEFHEAEEGSEVETRIYPGDILEVFNVGYDGGDGDSAWAHGVFSPDTEDEDGDYYTYESSLSEFENPDPTVPQDRPQQVN